MTDNVIYLHGKPREIAQVTRVGFREHGPCEQLLSANKLSSRRFVLEAATAATHRHKSLVRSLKDRKAEIVLDTNCAELSVPGKFSRSAKSAPWAGDRAGNIEFPAEAKFRSGSRQTELLQERSS